MVYKDSDPLFCLLIPFIVHSNYAMRVIIYIGLYIVLALGLNVVMGFTGLLNIGHAAFYAIGAYTTAILMVNHGMSFLAYHSNRDGLRDPLRHRSWVSHVAGKG